MRSLVSQSAEPGSQATSQSCWCRGLARTHLTWTWMANLKMRGFVDDVGRPDTVATRPFDGSRYQWQAADPQRLVDLIEHDLRLLLPNLQW
jgi:hypothetical protein